MEGKPQYCWKEGVVKHIDDIGQIHGSSGRCALFLELRNLKKWRNRKMEKERIEIVKLVEDIKKKF